MDSTSSCWIRCSQAVSVGFLKTFTVNSLRKFLCWSGDTSADIIAHYSMRHRLWLIDHDSWYSKSLLKVGNSSQWWSNFYPSSPTCYRSSSDGRHFKCLKINVLKFGEPKRITLEDFECRERIRRCKAVAEKASGKKSLGRPTIVRRCKFPTETFSAGPLNDVRNGMHGSTHYHLPKSPPDSRQYELDESSFLNYGSRNTLALCINNS